MTPDEMNEERALSGAQALEAYRMGYQPAPDVASRSIEGADTATLQQELMTLMTDLKHLCHQRGLDFNAAVEKAEECFLEDQREAVETRENEGDDPSMDMDNGLRSF